MKKKKKIEKLLYNAVIAFFLALVLVACAKTNAIATIEPTETIIPTVEVDLLVNLESSQGSIIEVQRGDVFKIQRPGLADEWQVSFDPDLFEPITSGDSVKVNEIDGWVFRAVKRGTGRFMFTSKVSCDEPVPCPMMPARLELGVDVR